MSDPQNHEELRQKVQESVDKLNTDSFNELTRIADMLNGAANEFMKLEWSDLAYLAGPIVGGIVDGLTQEDVDGAIERWNKEILPQVQDSISGLATDLKKVVDSLVGDPKGLKELSWKYADTREKLIIPGPTIEQEVAALGFYWEGRAFEAYGLVAKEQAKAMEAAAKAMETAATLTNKAGQQILQLWADLANQLINFMVDVIELLSDATTIDKILSFEIPVVISAVAKVLKFAQGIAKTLEDFMIKQGFEDALSWHKLNNGAEGLPQNVWPVLHPDLVGAIDDPTRWGVSQ